MARVTKSGNSTRNRSSLGLEATLWAAADKRRRDGRVFDPCCGSGGMFGTMKIFVGIRAHA